MSPDSVFVVVCPRCCGQSTRSIRYLGLLVRCKKCRHDFKAVDLHAQSASADDPVGIWLLYTSNHTFQENPRSPTPR